MEHIEYTYVHFSTVLTVLTIFTPFIHFITLVLIHCSTSYTYIPDLNQVLVPLSGDCSGPPFFSCQRA